MFGMDGGRLREERARRGKGEGRAWRRGKGAEGACEAVCTKDWEERRRGRATASVDRDEDSEARLTLATGRSTSQRTPDNPRGRPDPTFPKPPEFVRKIRPPAGPFGSGLNQAFGRSSTICPDSTPGVRGACRRPDGGKSGLLGLIFALY